MRSYSPHIVTQDHTSGTAAAADEGPGDEGGPRLIALGLPEEGDGDGSPISIESGVRTGSSVPGGAWLRRRVCGASEEIPVWAVRLWRSPCQSPASAFGE